MHSKMQSSDSDCVAAAARVDVRLETLTAEWVQQHSLALVGRNKEAAGTLQVPQLGICFIDPLLSSDLL